MWGNDTPLQDFARLLSSGSGPPQPSSRCICPRVSELHGFARDSGRSERGFAESISLNSKTGVQEMEFALDSIYSGVSCACLGSLVVFACAADFLVFARGKLKSPKAEAQALKP